MRHPRRASFALLLVAVTLITGCEILPVVEGQPVKLGPNEGIAAVAMDTLDELKQVSIDPSGSGSSLTIAKVPKGEHIYLFVVPVGQYCFTDFQFGSLSFRPKDMNKLVCFTVDAGKIAYSGHVGPRVFGKDDIRIDRADRRDEFEQELKAQYPDLAARYPIAIDW